MSSHCLTRPMSRSSQQNHKKLTLDHGEATSAPWTVQTGTHQVQSAHLQHRAMNFLIEVHLHQLFPMVKISTNVSSFPQVYIHPVSPVLQCMIFRECLSVVYKYQMFQSLLFPSVSVDLFFPNKRKRFTRQLT